MKKFVRWILSVFGYGAYTLAVLFLLLWLLFPAEGVRIWTQAQLERLGPPLSWNIDELRISWPLSIIARDIQAKEHEGEELLVHLDELKLRPDVTSITRLLNGWPVVYRVETLGGAVKGEAYLERGQTRFQLRGEMKNLQIAELDWVWQQMGRSGRGNLSGPFVYEGDGQDILSGSLQADLIVKDGSLELLQPVMGLADLPFNQLAAALSLEDRVVKLARGKIDSDLFAADFEGTVSLTDNLLGSGLDISGSFEPRPELMGSLKDPAVMQLIKGQLRDNRLMFQLTDTLLTPGIVFQGASGVIDGIIQGSGR